MSINARMDKQFDFRIGKSTETESRLEVPRDLGKEVMGNDYLKGTRFYAEVMKMFCN